MALPLRTDDRDENNADSKRSPKGGFAEQIQGAKPSIAVRLKSLLTNLGVAVCGTAVALLLIEIPVRLLWSPQHGAPSWTDRPRFYYVPEVSRGTSDYQYAVPKPAGTYRIAAVGDSFTFTPYMQFDDTFPKRLERMLNMNNQPPVPLHAEVVNYGRWGASTVNELRTVERAVEEGADMVVLEITLNDPEFSRYEASNKELQGKYTFGQLEITPTKNWLYYYWRAAGFVATRLHNNATAESMIRYHNDLFEQPDTWNSFASAVLRMKQVCDEKGVKFVAFVFPFIHMSLGADYPFKSSHDKIYAYLQHIGVPAMNPMPAFRGIPPERLIVAPGKDNHPNEIAHRIVAEELYSWLSKSNFLPQSLLVKKEFAKRGHRARTGSKDEPQTGFDDARGQDAE